MLSDRDPRLRQTQTPLGRYGSCRARARGEVLGQRDEIPQHGGGQVSGWLHGPTDHWVAELGRLVRVLRFDASVLLHDHEDVLGQTERFATEVVPRVREALRQTT